jgi:hypothetical protein
MYALPPVVLMPTAPTVWLAPAVLGPAPVPAPTPRTPVPAPPTETPETPIPVARLDATVEPTRGDVLGAPRPATPEAMDAPPIAAPGEEPGAVEPTVPLNPGVETGGAKLMMLVCARFAGAETLLASEDVPAAEPPALLLPTFDVTTAEAPTPAAGVPTIDGSVAVVVAVVLPVVLPVALPVVLLVVLPVVLTEVVEAEVMVMTVVVGLTMVTLAPPPLTGVVDPLNGAIDPLNGVVDPLNGVVDPLAPRVSADSADVVDVGWPIDAPLAPCATWPCALEPETITAATRVAAAMGVFMPSGAARSVPASGEAAGRCPHPGRRPHPVMGRVARGDRRRRAPGPRGACRSTRTPRRWRP